MPVTAGSHKSLSVVYMLAVVRGCPRVSSLRPSVALTTRWRCGLSVATTDGELRQRGQFVHLLLFYAHHIST